MSYKLPLCVIMFVGIAAATLLLSTGCQMKRDVAESGDGFDGASAQSIGTPGIEEYEGLGGAQAWSDNCMRCHNLRHPRERSDREWDIIVHHMRVRANLTAEEHRVILAFLKAAN